MQNRKRAAKLLASEARTANTASARQEDNYNSSVRLYLDVTAVPGAGGLQVVIRGYDQASGNAVELSAGGRPITQTGTYVYEMRRGPVPEEQAGVIEVTDRMLPASWDVLVKHGETSSYTYSLSAETAE